MLKLLEKTLRQAALKLLLKYAPNSLRTYSQAGQDLWVLELYPRRNCGFFLEIGALDGIHLSNTYMLEKHLAWRGICIEANPQSFEALKRNRTARCIQACLDDQEHEVEFVLNDVLGGIVDEDLDNTTHTRSEGEVIQLKTKTLNQVLKEANAPYEIHYMSIDIEGAEYRVLRNFDFDTYQVNALSVERPNAELRELLREKGFILVKEIYKLDCFYVHQSLWEKHRNSIITHYKNGMFIHRYQ